MTHGLKAYDGLSLPEDAETVTVGRAGWSYLDLSDDEDLLADEASGGGQGVPVAGSGGGEGQGWDSSPWALKRPWEVCSRWPLKRWGKSCVCPEPWSQ